MSDIVGEEYLGTMRSARELVVAEFIRESILAHTLGWAGDPIEPISVRIVIRRTRWGGRRLRRLRRQRIIANRERRLARIAREEEA